MASSYKSLQVHSIRLYDGTYKIENIPYRIGNDRTTIRFETENYYDTWDDFHLIPTARPILSLPTPNTKFVSIPGRKDPIDLTEYLTGHSTFGNRTGSWSFFTDVDYVEQRLGGWIAFDKRLRSLFHGHVGKIVLLDNPSYFYTGELTMGQWQTGDDRSTVTISYDLYPYKKDLSSTMELWKFDEFDFRDGVIMYLKDMEVNGSRDVKVYGSRERISPHISGSSGLVVYKYENKSWVNYGNVPTKSIASNDSIIPRLVIDYGENLLRFTGTGSVTIDYRRGLL